MHTTLGADHSLYGNLPGPNPEPPNQNQNAGHAFAAMPQPFEQNDPFHHGRAGGRTPYMSSRPLKTDGGLNLQEKTWSGATYMLAPACSSTTDPQDVKSLVLEHAIESIRSGNGKWKTKVDCLVNHFNQILILTSATLALEDFNNCESGLYGYVFLSQRAKCGTSTHQRPDRRRSSRYHNELPSLCPVHLRGNDGRQRAPEICNARTRSPTTTPLSR